jgi:REP element-mobilizing transposase RayT
MDYADRQRFVDTLGEVCAKTCWQVHAYVLMPNHFYWVVETPPPNLVAGMKWLLGSYTKRSRSSLLTQPGAYCVSRRQSGFDYPGHPKPEDLRLRRQNASSGHPGINHPCLSVWAKLPAGSSGTWPYLAEMLSPRRSLSRSALHDCRGGLLRCTGKAAGHVPGLRFIKIRESFCDLVSPDPSPQGHGVGRPHPKCFQSPIVGLHRNVDLRALLQCSAIRKTNGRNGTD